MNAFAILLSATLLAACGGVGPDAGTKALSCRSAGPYGGARSSRLR